MQTRDITYKKISGKSFDVISQVIIHLPYYAMLLNEQREVLIANELTANENNCLMFTDLVHKRPGDLFQCENAKEAGCGNSKYCSYCGIYKTIDESLKHNKPSMCDSKLMVNRDNKIQVYEFTAKCSPLFVEKTLYLLLTLVDIRSESRKTMLEKIFFHDILNIINGQNGIVQFLLYANKQSELYEYINCLQKVTENLVRTILDQRDLIYAENNELTVCKKKSKSRTTHIIDYCQYQVTGTVQ